MHIVKNRFGALIAAALFTVTAAAETYPSRTVRTILPYSVGSGPDVVMRNLGVHFARDWGQSVIVDNKPGANGWLAIGDAKRAAPDGHTLLMVDGTYMTLQPNLYKKLPFDPVGDFVPVAPVYTTNLFVFVSASSPWKSLADMLTDPKAKNGGLNYGSWGIGSTAHFASAMLEHASGTPMTHVPFKELPMVYMAVAAGEIDWAFGALGSVAPLVKSGKLKMLAFAGDRRLDAYPNVPTVPESGGPAGFALPPGWVALFAPKGTPNHVVEQIHAETAKALQEADVRKSLAAVGYEPWVGAPALVRKTIDAETLRYAEAVKRFKISID
jgi:tripartite-type tricarboxylate transporter receptor subunit TctC